VLLDFHPSHESGRATQHGHTQTELRGKPTDIERRVSIVPFEKVQGLLPFGRSPLLEVSPVQCAQSRYFIATSRISYSKQDMPVETQGIIPISPQKVSCSVLVPLPFVKQMRSKNP
jgi:hypothetical protein